MPRHRRRTQICSAAGAIALLATSCASEGDSGEDAAGGDFPNGTVTIVVGSDSGSTMDHLARGLAPRLQELWDETVVVDNVPGANQSAGYHEAAQAEPDGHTLFITVHGTMGIHGQLGTIDPDYEEFAWFGTLLEEPWAFHAAADGPYETFDDLLEQDPVRYGDSGFESPVNPVAVTVFEALGHDYLFTPGYDPGDAQGSVLSGEQDFVGRDVAQMLRTGTDEDYRTLLVLADEPHDLAPDAMTLSDLREEYDVDIPEQEIFQLGFPIGTTPGTPDEVVDELADAVTHLIDEDEEFQEWLDENHMSESVLSERIGREVTQEYVANVASQYAEFGMDDIEDRLQSAE